MVASLSALILPGARIRARAPCAKPALQLLPVALPVAGTCCAYVFASTPLPRPLPEGLALQLT